MRIGAYVAGLLYLPGAALVVALYLWANGLTAGALVLATSPLLAVLGFLADRRPALRRRALTALAVFVVLDLLWVGARIARSGGEGLRVCVNTQCDGRGAFWQRVPDEREAARAGLYVSSLSGTVSRPEFKAFDGLLDTEYARVPAPWRGLPNALLMRSSPSRIESHRWIPPLAEKAPCVVFLHGYGGSLTVYLRAFVESEIGKRFVVVAPALDNIGDWRSERGLEVLERVVEQLPPEVDRSRLYVAGLSNGAVGVTTVLSRPKLLALFKGVVMISGVDAVDRGLALEGARVLMFAGIRDPRFPHRFVKQQSEGLQLAGAAVELVSLDADHYLILTHAQEWTTRFLAWEGALP